MRNALRFVLIGIVSTIVGYLLISQAFPMVFAVALAVFCAMWLDRAVMRFDTPIYRLF